MSISAGVEQDTYHPQGTATLRYRLSLQQRALARNAATCRYSHEPYHRTAAYIAANLIGPGCCPVGAGAALQERAQSQHRIALREAELYRPLAFRYIDSSPAAVAAFQASLGGAQ